MKIYGFNCYGIKCKGSKITFSADGFPLNQNCDVVELHKMYNTTRLIFWYDNGTKRVDYEQAFEYIYINSSDEYVDIYVCDDNLGYKYYPIGFEIIHIILKKSEFLYQLKSQFAFDKMISLKEWR